MPIITEEMINKKFSMLDDNMKELIKALNIEGGVADTINREIIGKRIEITITDGKINEESE